MEKTRPKDHCLWPNRLNSRRRERSQHRHTVNTEVTYHTRDVSRFSFDRPMAQNEIRTAVINYRSDVVSALSISVRPQKLANLFGRPASSRGRPLEPFRFEKRITRF
ncbi:hypothetical protein EVAR_34435_1 [Eumeta japonica]|uniref:Uncharacterized protein n=1 Tax=Eumeta variegata TaxID=151549 RepID=A0A4C1WML9_EUMVA|nr:hypothetical protein EVAR_34435_1 [Eumeta japonica]